MRSIIFAGLLVLLCLAPAQAQTTAARLARGTYLGEVVMACGSCHDGANAQGQPQPNMPLAGGIIFAERPFRAVAANISQDRETGIGAWTDAQIVTALREGRRPDGSLIGPPMPIDAYRGVSDADMRALVAWLRSKPAVRHAPAKSTFTFPLQPYGAPITSVAAPAETPVARGRYLAENLAHCMECHSAQVNGKADPTRRGAPGLVLEGPWGAVQARNISSHRESGIGRWTDAQILGAVTRGVSADGRQLLFPMGFRAPIWARMEQRDQRDLVAYLRSLPPQD